MKLNSSDTTLVIAGAWNAAIVTPEWIIRHCLVQPAEAVRVQAHIPAGPGLVVDFPRFTIGDFSFTARPDALILSPARNDGATLALVETVAQRILENLTHTPVGGLGQNFEFSEEAPATAVLAPFTAAQQDLADIKPESWEVRGSAIGTVFEVNVGLNVNVQRNLRNARLVVRFNFHHNVTSADTCAAVLRREGGENSMHANLEIAKQLMTSIYGDLEDENEPAIDS